MAQYFTYNYEGKSEVNISVSKTSVQEMHLK